MKCKCIQTCTPAMSTITFNRDYIYEYRFENDNLYKVWKDEEHYGVFSKEKFYKYFLRQTPIITPNNVMENNEEMVNHPSHYAEGVECIDMMLQQFGKEDVKAFCLLNSFKYLWRCKKKHSNPVEDVSKTLWYAQKYIDLVKDESK